MNEQHERKDEEHMNIPEMRVINSDNNNDRPGCC